MESSDKLKKFSGWTVFLLVIVFTVIFLSACIIYGFKNPDFYLDIAKSHFVAVVGLPLSAIAALCLVQILQITSGDIEFKVLGFEFKGASGQVILWVIVFLAIVLGIRIVW